MALACAARETLHIGDIVETMLRQTMTALMTDDRKLVAEICRMDNAVDRLDEAVKLYVTKLTRESLDEREGHRAMEIISFSINLEHVGDIIDKNLMELASKKIKRKLVFSKEGAAELEAFHQEVLSNLKLAFSVFMSGDVRIARQLIAEKAQLRAAELAAAESHLARLARGPPREHRIELAASRRPARPETHPLAYLLGRLSGARARRRVAGARHRQERSRAGRADVPAEAAVIRVPSPFAAK